MARPKGSKNTKSKAAKPDKAKPKSKPAPAAAAENAPDNRVKGSEQAGAITKSVLNSILTLDKRTKRQQSELAGEIGSAVAKAVERFGTNGKALSIIRTLNRMEPEKLRDFLDDFDYMLDISGLEDRADSVQPLPLAGAAEDEGGDAEEAAAGEAGPEAGQQQAAKSDSGDGKVSRPAFGRPTAEVA